MFLISHERKPNVFSVPGALPGGSCSCLDMVSSADVNASHARPRAPLRKLVSDTENKFTFFLFTGTGHSLLIEKLSWFPGARSSRQAGQAPVTKVLDGDLCFCSLFFFKTQPTKFLFFCPRLQTLAGSRLRNSLADGHFKWKTVPIWNFSVWAKMLVKTLNFSISFRPYSS